MDDSQLREYLPVLMLGLLAAAFSFGMLVLSVLLARKGKRSPIKDTAYECGMLPVGEGNTRLSVKFYSCGNAVHLVRCGNCVSVSVGGDLQGDAQAKMQI